MEETGTVIAGTLRPEDLAPAWLDELEARDISRAELIMADYRSILAVIENTDEWLPADYEEADWLLDDLYRALNEVAPNGYYFGGHPGDPADFGYWPIEEEEVAQNGS